MAIAARDPNHRPSLTEPSRRRIRAAVGALQVLLLEDDRVVEELGGPRAPLVDNAAAFALALTELLETNGAGAIARGSGTTVMPESPLSDGRAS